MPESDISVAIYSPVMDHPSPSYESLRDTDHTTCDFKQRTERTLSVESLNTLLSKMPEISIPSTLYNPLPLQCLAVNALPNGVKMEIDGVIAEYTPSTPDCGSSPSEPVAAAASDTVSVSEVDSLTAALHRALGIEEAGSKGAVESSPVSVHQVTIHREHKDDEFGEFGIKLSGGVRCTNCSELHAIVTAVSPCLYDSDELVEGLCVYKWNGHVLDGSTYEEAQRVVTTCSTLDSVEIHVKKCSENLMINRGSFDWLPSFAAVRINKMHKDSSEDKRCSDPKSVCSDDSTEKSTPCSPARASRAHLNLPFLDGPPAPSPVAETRKPVIIPSSTDTLLASMEGSDYSSIMSKQTNGMVQLSLDYNNDFEELNISLLQVKGQSCKELSDTTDVFINTYLVPDRREQGVRSITTSQVRKETGEYTNNSYMMSTDEITNTALRVILWDGHKSKSFVFRGEVLLGLSDDLFVNLVAEPTWYKMCPADPNLSTLPPPVSNRHKNGVDNLLLKLKQKAHSLTNVKPAMKSTTSLSSGLRATSMLSLPGSTEKKTMTLMRKKKRKDTRKTQSGSFEPDFKEFEPIPSSPVEVNNDSRQTKLSTILNVLREDLGDAGKVENTDTNLKPVNKHKAKATLNANSHHHFSTLIRKPKKKQSDTRNRVSFPDRSSTQKAQQDSITTSYSFLTELQEQISKQNRGLSPIPTEEVHVINEQVHYTIVDSQNSEEEVDSLTKSDINQDRDLNSCNSESYVYPAEVTLHRVNVQDVDKIEEARKRAFTLPVDTRAAQPKLYLPVTRTNSDTRPPKPPKTYRSKSYSDIEKLGSEEELFIVRCPNDTPVHSGPYTGLGSVDDLDVVEPGLLDDSLESTLDSGIRRQVFASQYCLDEEPDFTDGEERHIERTKTKWKSLEDILGGGKPKKARGKATLNSPSGKRQLTKKSSTPESSSKPNPGSVKLDFQFNDLNQNYPVLMVKMSDVILTSSKGKPSELMMKCYVNHNSTGVCVLKDKTPICLKNNPTPSAPLGILQFGTEIANLSVQVHLCGGSKKMFSRRVIGQTTVDLASLDLKDGNLVSQWCLLSKPTLTT